MSWGTTVLLVRHAQSTANSAGVLGGRADGIGLDEAGLRQAEELGARLASVPIDRLVSSPSQRCRATLEPLANELGLAIGDDDRLAEVDSGDWTGRALKDLAKEPLWRVVQHHPAAATFPSGEGLAAVSARAIAAVRDLARAGAAPGATPGERPTPPDSVPEPAAAGPKAPAGRPAAEPSRSHTIVVCSHGDVIKAVLADALGLHLDSFQRIVVAPGSLSVVRYTPLRPFVERINDTGNLQSLRPFSAPSAARQASPDPSLRPPPIGESDAIPGGVGS
jgi:broad specificity phosphatase PhoE